MISEIKNNFVNRIKPQVQLRFRAARLALQPPAALKTFANKGIRKIGEQAATMLYPQVFIENEALKKRLLTHSNLSEFILEIAAKGIENGRIRTLIPEAALKNPDVYKVKEYEINGAGLVKFTGSVWPEQMAIGATSSYSRARKPDGYIEKALQNNEAVFVERDEKNKFPFIIVPLGKYIYKIDFKSLKESLVGWEKELLLEQAREFTVLIEILGILVQSKTISKIMDSLHASRDEKEVYKILKNSLQNILGYQRGTIFEYRNDKIREAKEARFGRIPQIAAYSDWKSPDGIYKKAIETFTTTQENLPMPHIVVPLKFGKKLYGLMDIYRWKEGDPINPTKAALLTTLGNIGGMALRLIKEEKLSEKVKRGLLHEIKNKIAPVIGFINRTAKQIDKAKISELEYAEPVSLINTIKKNLAIIIGDARLIEKIANELREAIIKELSQGEYVADFNDLIRTKIEAFYNGLSKNITEECKIVFDLSKEGSSVFLNPSSFSHLVLNELIINATKYGATEMFIRTLLSKDKKEVQLVIEDNGRGIHKNDLPNVLKEGYRGDGTSEITGDGEGLFIANEIVEDLGGNILVESQLGKWTRFTIALPLSKRKK